MIPSKIRSKANDFEHLTNWRLPDGRIYAFALRAWCSTCTGSDVQQLPFGNAYTCPQTLAEKVFRNKGWFVGHGRKHDQCPTCIAREQLMREERRAAKVVKLPTPVPVTDPVEEPMATVQAEAPRTMTREDRRIIFEKINEVYISETVGYTKGWSDKLVAQDLGVPVAWVSKLRDTNFGPSGHNEEYTVVLDEIKELRRELEPVLQEVREAEKNVDALTKKSGLLQQRLMAAEKSLEKLQKQF